MPNLTDLAVIIPPFQSLINKLNYKYLLRPNEVDSVPPAIHPAAASLRSKDDGVTYFSYL